MEIPKIPTSEIFKVCLLDSTAKIKKIYIFCGCSQININNDELFSKNLNSVIDIDKPEISYSKLQIHYDDTINTIKQKIINEIGVNSVSYDELYLFSTIKEKINISTLYQDLTNKEQNDIKPEMFTQLLMNLNIENALKDNFKNKTSYDYEDLLILDHDREHYIKIPIGIKFNKYVNLLYPASPFDLISSSQSIFDNSLLGFDNSLLLNYGNLIDNELYLCMANDIFDYSIENQIDEKYVSNMYFPHLSANSIFNKKNLLENQRVLLNKNKELKITQNLKAFDAIDIFYNIYHNRKNELKYEDKGIQSFHIILHPDMKTNLPLDAIFKSIHTTNNMAYIKYNPGIRRENIYRLYSEQISKTGKKIPFLSKSTIMNLSKQSSKARQISLYIVKEYDNTNIEFFIDFEYNCNIHIKTTLVKPISPNELNELVMNTLNPIIEQINDLLEQTGYVINKMENITKNNVEIVDMKLVYSIKTDSGKINLQDYNNCLTNIFNINDNNISKGALLTYKRVENFREMDSISSMINDVYDKTHNERAVVLNLIQNFNLTEEEALIKISHFLNDYTRIDGRYVNKEVDIVETPGFPCIFHYKPFENKFIAEINNVSAIQYIECIDIYIDSFLRLSIDPTSIGIPMKDIQKICSKNIQLHQLNEKTVIVPNVEKVIQPLTYGKMLTDIDEEEDEGMFFYDEDEIDYKTQSLLNVDTVKKLDGDEEQDEYSGLIFDENDSDEEGMLFYDDEDEEQQIGGDTVKLYNDNGVLFDNKPLNKKEIFFSKMKRLEPKLFAVKDTDGFSSYSRICPTNNNLQPIILTQEEKDKIDKEHPDSYTKAITYGSDTNNPYYYICPRYWCLLTNTSLTEEEAKSGKCGKIIPQNPPNNLIPKGHYVYEFTDDRYHKDASGEYVKHYPGFKSPSSHPDGLCLPCCYNNWGSGQQIGRRKECGVEKDGKDKKNITDKTKESDYIIGVERYPLPHKRFGFLPISLEDFFNINHNASVKRDNPALIKENKPILLRYGTEPSLKQSFIACLAEIYSEEQNKANPENLITTPTIKEMLNIINETITLDMFLKANNGTMPTIFKTEKQFIDETVRNKYADTEFYKSIDQTNEPQNDFLDDTILAFENFKEFIKDDNSYIDYTYLWDFITIENPKLIINGLNLVIINILSNDITENIEIICPTIPYSSKLYDPNKQTVIILKRNDLFEPIYLYNIVNGKKEITKRFYKTTTISNIKTVLSAIEKTMGKYCSPKESIPKIYKYKRNKPAIDIYNILLHEYNYDVISQVLNYQSKVIGLITKTRNEDKNIFVPTYPSNIIDKLNIIYTDNNNIWNDYRTTRDELIELSNVTNNKILCKPMVKVIEDEFIVGILTETNQFIQTIPPQQNIEDDGIDYINSSNYLIADNNVILSKEQDKERTEIIKKISLESQFFLAFRSTIRTLLNQYENRDIRENILQIMNATNYYYNDKIIRLEYFLKKLTKNAIVFSEIQQDVLNKLDEISTCTSKCDNKPFCLLQDNNNCKLIIPKKHLISNIDNKKIYYGRMADELLRYNRIRIFMFNPKTYLNIGNIEYKINKNEFIMLQSLLTNEYFDDLIPFQMNKYVNNITFELAKPMISDKYDNTIKYEIETNNINNECQKVIRETVLGNKTNEWRKLFREGITEVVFNNTANCSFYVIIKILFQRTMPKVLYTTTEIKKILWSKYKEYMENYSLKIENILTNQGKSDLIRKIKTKVVSLEDIIMSESYYMTNLDLWLLAIALKLPIFLFSTNEFNNMVTGINWLLLSKENFNISGNYYFIRSPGSYGKNEIPTYNLISRPFKLNELKGFDNKVIDAIGGKGDYTRNVISFDKFIQTYTI